MHNMNWLILTLSEQNQRRFISLQRKKKGNDTKFARIRVIRSSPTRRSHINHYIFFSDVHVYLHKLNVPVAAMVV